MLAALSAFAASIVASGLIYFSWRKGNADGSATSGWLLAFVSILLWSYVLGVEIGVTYSIMVFVCLIWIIVIFTMDAKKSVSEPPLRPYQALQWPALKSGFKHCLLFILSVPASGIITMMLSVAIVLYLPWTMQAKLAVAIFLYPILWGALSAWICAQKKVLRPSLVSVGLLTLSSVILLS